MLNDTTQRYIKDRVVNYYIPIAEEKGNFYEVKRDELQGIVGDVVDMYREKIQRNLDAVNMYSGKEYDDKIRSIRIMLDEIENEDKLVEIEKMGRDMFDYEVKVRVREA